MISAMTQCSLYQELYCEEVTCSFECCGTADLQKVLNVLWFQNLDPNKKNCGINAPQHEIDEMSVLVSKKYGNWL